MENDLYRITFTNRGGRVKSWILKEYDGRQGQPLELVNGAAAENTAIRFRYGPGTRLCVTRSIGTLSTFNRLEH